MPLYKEWNPNLHSLAAIWHISEPEAFFAEKVSVSAAHITHSKRRIEFLAGRFVLQYLNKDFPLHAILRDEHDKPQLPDREFHFSISHSFPYVACVISTHSAVGIDIQCWHKSILSLQHKFLSEREQIHCEQDPKKITLAWSIKEAAYKYQGLRGVEFIEHLPISKWEQKEEYFDISIKLQLIDPVEKVNVKGLLFDDFALAFVVK